MNLANGRPYLAIPGPSTMPDRVLAAMHRAAPNIYAGALPEMVETLWPDLRALAGTVAMANGGAPASRWFGSPRRDAMSWHEDPIDAAQADAMVVAAYGLILPQWVLDAPRLGCLNIHASLLPRWRGAAPIHRAIEAGDTETGVTIMQMDAGLDTGDMLLVERLSIRADDTTGSLHDRLAVLGGRLVVEALEIAACGGLSAQKQPTEGVTYAHKIDKAEAALDWSQPAVAIERRVRAFDPFPGAGTGLGAEAIKVWAAQVRPGQGDPGAVLAVSPQGIAVGTGSGVLELTELQRAGGRRLPVAEFLRGFSIAPGQTLATPP